MEQACTETLAACVFEEIHPIECVVPGEVLLDIFDMLPSRTLLAIRSISHEFLLTVDCLIRSRLLRIIKDRRHEIVFESSSPAEYRNTHRQVLAFDRFETSSKDATCADIAYFNIAASTPLPQYLPLDDEEQFGSYLLSVHLRGVEAPAEASPAAPSSSPPETRQTTGWGVAANDPSLTWTRTAPAPLPITATAVGRRSGPSAAPTPNSTPPSRPRTVLSFSLLLAEGLDRLYRSWFEDPSMVLLRIPPSRLRMRDFTLVPSGACGLIAAHISTVQVEPTESGTSMAMYPFNTGYGSTTYTPSTPTMFEFYYKCVVMDVAKIVVAIEEGLDTGSKRGEIVMWMRM